MFTEKSIALKCLCSFFSGWLLLLVSYICYIIRGVVQRDVHSWLCVWAMGAVPFRHQAALCFFYWLLSCLIKRVSPGCIKHKVIGCHLYRHTDTRWSVVYGQVKCLSQDQMNSEYFACVWNQNCGAILRTSVSFYWLNAMIVSTNCFPSRHVTEAPKALWLLLFLFCQVSCLYCFSSLFPTQGRVVCFFFFPSITN